jgi:uncharacterized protein YbaR (Trm112 family)
MAENTNFKIDGQSFQTQKVLQNELIGLACPVCKREYDLFEAKPIKAFCNHTLCQNCIQGHTKIKPQKVNPNSTGPHPPPKTVFKCPVCHHKFEVKVSKEGKILVKEKVSKVVELKKQPPIDGLVNNQIPSSFLIDNIFKTCPQV